MNAARHFLAICLFTLATPVHAAWDDFRIDDIYDKVVKVFNKVQGDVSDAVKELLDQRKDRVDDMRDAVEDIVSWFQNRKTPLKDFVSGGPGRCGTGSPCAKFRSDLLAFALQMAELKDRFPVLEQHGLGDTAFFAELVKILPPVILFGAHEILQRIPGWQDLPVDLADVFDEIGDPEVFSTEQASAQLAAASVARGMKTASAASLPLTSLGKPVDDFEKFCNRGVEAVADEVALVRLKGIVYRWKNRFDSYSEYFKDDDPLTFLGQSFPSIKYPGKPFLHTVSNALDSLHDMMEAHRDKLGACAKVEQDISACTTLVEYRTPRGARQAYFVMSGVLKRATLASVDQTNAKRALDKAKQKYNAGRYSEVYAYVCQSYVALWPAGATVMP
jgi:hypothetical protein